MATLLAKVALASAVLALVCWGAQRWLLAGWEHELFATKAIALTATIGDAIGAFLGCGWLLRIEELLELGQALRRRARGAA